MESCPPDIFRLIISEVAKLLGNRVSEHILFLKMAFVSRKIAKITESERFRSIAIDGGRSDKLEHHWACIKHNSDLLTHTRRLTLHGSHALWHEIDEIM
jgi:hypothetical protein